MNEKQKMGKDRQGNSSLENGGGLNRTDAVIFHFDRLKGFLNAAQEVVKEMDGHAFYPVPVSHLAEVPGLHETVAKLFGEVHGFDHSNIHPIRLIEEHTISGLVHVHHEYEAGFRILMLDNHILIPE